MPTRGALAGRIGAYSAVLCASVAIAQFRNPSDRSAPPGQNPGSGHGRAATPIILISVDTLRADHLSCYGYKRLATPHIDRIAAGGTLFLQVSSQVPLTLPSHTSLFTSTYPFANGIEDNGEHLAPNTVTLARVLKSRGYRTAAFVGGFVLDRRFGLDQGFDTYEGPSNPRPQEGKDPGDVKRFAEDVTQSATRWLEQNADHPFFLFVHLYDLHTPYTLPASERRRGSGYDAELGYVDDVLGKFWDILQRSALIQRAIIVLTADHGESLRDHGESTHGYFAYQSTLRVPLMIHWPTQSAGFAAQVTDPVALLDLAPTLLEAAGIAPPREFQGHNLLPGITASAPASRASEEIYSESVYPHAHFAASALRALRIGAYKYINAPRPEFYDLAHDPEEKENLYESKKSTALAFRERLERLRGRYRSISAPPKRAPGPDTLELLNSLGYLGHGIAGSSPADTGPDPKDLIVQYEEYGRAMSLARAGHVNASNVALEQLLANHPNLPDVRASLALNQQKLGHHSAAAENFRAILKQDPLSAVAHFDLAVSERALGRPQDAEKELRAALQLDPYYIRAEEMLATLYLEERNYELARARLKHLIEIDPANYIANYNLGVLDTMEGKWDAGEGHLLAAIQIQPASAEAHNMLGSIHMQRGDLGPAGAEFAEAIRVDPQFAAAHYNLGIILRRQQKSQEAAQEFQKVLSIDPSFQPARAALDRLQSAPTGK
jgi:arylsulfatase A-like enzyme/Tfp pilus assembly protein PilF